MDVGTREAGRIGHEAVGRAVVEVVGAAPLVQPAGVHDPDLVGHGEGLELVVRDQQGGQALLPENLPHLPGQLLPHFPVEAGEGFVQEQQVGPRRHGPGQGHPLLLAAGKLVGEGGRRVLEADQGEQFPHPQAPPAAVVAAQAEGDVVGHVQVREEGQVLEDHPHPAPLRGKREARAAHRPPAQENLAGLHRFEAGDGPQQGGLAAAAGPEQAADPSDPQPQADLPHHRRALVGDRDVVNLKQHGLLPAGRGGWNG